MDHTRRLSTSIIPNDLNNFPATFAITQCSLAYIVGVVLQRGVAAELAFTAVLYNYFRIQHCIVHNISNMALFVLIL